MLGIQLKEKKKQKSGLKKHMMAEILCQLLTSYIWKLPGVNFLIAADNDQSGKGLKCALRAAKVAGHSTVVVPDEPGTDWNDYMLAHGVMALRAKLEEAGLGIGL